MSGASDGKVIIHSESTTHSVNYKTYICNENAKVEDKQIFCAEFLRISGNMVFAF